MTPRELKSKVFLCAGDLLCPQPAQHVLRIDWATEGKHEPLLDYWSRCFTADTVLPRPQCQCSEFSLPYCLSEYRRSNIFMFCTCHVNSLHSETSSSLGATILCEFWPAQQFFSFFFYPEPSYFSSEFSFSSYPFWHHSPIWPSLSWPQLVTTLLVFTLSFLHPFLQYAQSILFHVLLYK
jgi:hypothetical protein